MDTHQAKVIHQIDLRIKELEEIYLRCTTRLARENVRSVIEDNQTLLKKIIEQIKKAKPCNTESQ